MLYLALMAPMFLRSVNDTTDQDGDDTRVQQQYTKELLSEYVQRFCANVHFSESNQGSSQLYLINFLHDVSMYYLSPFVQVFI